MTPKALLLIVAMCLCSTPLFGQVGPAPPGESEFIRSVGGFATGRSESNFFEEMTRGKIDKVFAGGGAGEWAEIAGRIFLTRKWSIEIEEISENYNAYDLEKGIMAAMRKRLEAEGFALSPETTNFSSIRYQKGSTAGSIEFSRHFLSSGNLPLKLDFIFTRATCESRPERRRRPDRVGKSRTIRS